MMVQSDDALMITWILVKIIHVDDAIQSDDMLMITWILVKIIHVDDDTV